MAEVKTAKKLTGGIVAIVILALCLCITTFALVYASVSVNNNIFCPAAHHRAQQRKHRK